MIYNLDDVEFDERIMNSSKQSFEIRSKLAAEIEKFKPNYYNLNFTTETKILKRRKVGSKKLTKEDKELRKSIYEILKTLNITT